MRDIFSWQILSTFFTALFQHIQKKIDTALKICILFFSYLVAIGVTSLVAKLFGKRFLSTTKASTWVDFHSSQKLDRMY